MLKRLIKLAVTGLAVCSLTACSSGASHHTDDVSQSLQKSKISKKIKPEACNYADILSDNENLDHNHTIAELAVMMEEDSNLNPATKEIGGSNVGLFQVPKGRLERFAKAHHLKYTSANAQIRYVSDSGHGSSHMAIGFHRFKQTYSRSDKKLAQVFYKDVMRGPVDKSHLDHNVDELEGK